MRVTFNVVGSYDSPIDSGLRVRRAHEILHLSLQEVGVCNALLAIERPSKPRGSASLIAEVHVHHREGIEWVTQTFPAHQRGVTGVFWRPMPSPILRRLATSRPFAEQFLSHTGSSANEPAVVLRRFLDRSSRAALRGASCRFAVLRCLEAHCRGTRSLDYSWTTAGLNYFAELRAAKGI